MPSLEKSAGQVLKDFEEMMKLLKPYLPKPAEIISPKSKPYKISEELLPYTTR